MASKTFDPTEAAWKGIELCREGDWNEGLYWLSQAAATDDGLGNLPALFYAYLGYGVAKYQKQEQQGLSLCRRAVDLELYQPETYYFLARTHLLLGDRRQAFQVVERGLRVDASHSGLLELRADLGERRPPVLPFLARRHPFNRWLGLARHRLFGRRAS
ncbi:MAG: hypothetical protein AAF657_18775 [Acidobacteriota bacterium]